jgi:hypothetical protein
MIARIKNILFPAFMRRLDRWLLLRAPMLWRTRLLHLLVPLSLAVLAIVPFMQTSIEDPREVPGIASDTVNRWRTLLFWGVVVLVAWILSIIKKPVGELVPHRHVVTVVAVAIGSYLCLLTPSLLAYPHINAIKSVGPSDQVLNSDLEFLARYGDWYCVPPEVWDKNGSELEQLRNVLDRYGYGHGGDLKKGPINEDSSCHREGNFPLSQSWVVSDSKKIIGTIRDAQFRVRLHQ